MNKDFAFTDYLDKLSEALKQSEGKANMYTSFTTSSCNSCDIGDDKKDSITMKKEEKVA